MLTRRFQDDRKIYGTRRGRKYEARFGAAEEPGISHVPRIVGTVISERNEYSKMSATRREGWPGCKIWKSVSTWLINKRDIGCEGASERAREEKRDCSSRALAYLYRGYPAIPRITADANAGGCALRAEARDQKVRFTILGGLVNFSASPLLLKVSRLLREDGTLRDTQMQTDWDRSRASFK